VTGCSGDSSHVETLWAHGIADARRGSATVWIDAGLPPV